LGDIAANTIEPFDDFLGPIERGLYMGQIVFAAKVFEKIRLLDERRCL
jgi:hypothetical protein